MDSVWGTVEYDSNIGQDAYGLAQTICTQLGHGPYTFHGIVGDFGYVVIQRVFMSDWGAGLWPKAPGLCRFVVRLQMLSDKAEIVFA